MGYALLEPEPNATEDGARVGRIEESPHYLVLRWPFSTINAIEYGRTRKHLKRWDSDLTI